MVLSMVKQLMMLRKNGNDNAGMGAWGRGVCAGCPSWPTALTDVARLGLTIAIFGLLLLSSARAETVASLDDISFWVGSGENRAAMVIDWDDTGATDESLVWGYRWDGTATGQDMLLAVLESETRLFGKLDFSGSPLYGLGYDNNCDGQFAISDDTAFNVDGIAFTSEADGETSVDPNDLYAEGWYTGFWHYGISSGNPFGGGSWLDSGGGMASRALADGDWDSWAFTPTFDFGAFAENPHAAIPPLPADFDCDEDVDGSDFLAWQRGFGITSGAMHSQGDADDDGDVDSVDLQAWKNGFGSPPISTLTTLTVPEPSTVWLVAISLFTFFIVLKGRMV